MANYFIMVEDGPDVRRKLLESSKASLHVLKGYHELLRIRGEKLTHMNALRNQLKELTILVNRAEALMPTLTERELEELQPRAAKPLQMRPAKPAAPAKPEGIWVKKGNRKVFIAAPKQKVVSEVPVAVPQLDAPESAKPQPRKLTELEKLEAALKGIESKLGNL